MSKARVALNDLVEKAWVELDDHIIECKEYKEMSRGTFDQVAGFFFYVSIFLTIEAPGFDENVMKR